MSSVLHSEMESDTLRLVQENDVRVSTSFSFILQSTVDSWGSGLLSLVCFCLCLSDSDCDSVSLCWRNWLTHFWSWWVLQSESASGQAQSADGTGQLSWRPENQMADDISPSQIWVRGGRRRLRFSSKTGSEWRETVLPWLFVVLKSVADLTGPTHTGEDNLLIQLAHTEIPHRQNV